MATYVVHFDAGTSSENFERVETAYPAAESYQMGDDLFMVRAQNVTTELVAKKLGILTDDDEDSAVGVVLRLNGSRSGLYRPSIWEWLALDSAVDA